MAGMGTLVISVYKSDSAVLFEGAVKLGQAKLIIRFPFQGFQNNMWADGHFSLFIMAKILRKLQKTSIMKSYKKIMKFCKYLKIHACGANFHITIILWHLQKSMRVEMGI